MNYFYGLMAIAGIYGIIYLIGLVLEDDEHLDD